MKASGEESQIRRDIVGYGATPPIAEWPGGRRMALSIVLNYEEGSERTPAYGDSVHELSTEARYDVKLEDRELIQESTFEYGSRVGHWRILDLLDRYRAKCTVFACGMALEQNPAIAEALVQRGHDIAGHGYRWIPHYGMSEAEEREDVRRAIASIRAMTGVKILGWFTRPVPTTHTRRILAEEGLLYDCTAVNDDLPYFDRVADRPFLILPYSLDTNDIRFWKGFAFTAQDFFEYMRDTFDTLYAESLHTPRMMSVGLHGRVVGRPGRIVALERFLEHVSRFDDVWIAGRDDIAKHWLQRFAPPNTWNLSSLPTSIPEDR